MRIGIDFDNTLVCYDQLFDQVARRHKLLPDNLPPLSKTGVRQHLRESGREREWTQLQGLVYGPEILSAPPFPGALETLRQLEQSGHQLFLVSHKTLHPVIGEAHDLRQAARNWLANRELRFQEIYFASTRSEKISKIQGLALDVFVDDLPEVFEDPAFPLTTRRLLFSPGGQLKSPGWESLSHWSDLLKVLRVGAEARSTE